jgi:undecaprenyl-diphosphatase
MAFDYALFHLLNSVVGRTSFVDTLVIVFAEYVPVVLVVWGALALARMSRGLRWPIDAFAAAIFARFVVVGSLWQVIPRDRPFLTHDITHLFIVNHPSFPSAHASFLFAFATMGFLYNRTLGVVLYVGAFLSCTARVVAGVHYPSDILAGAVVGAASAVGIALAARLLRK